MQQPRLGELKRLDPRTAWQNEALQFTPWLVEHISALNDELELEIEPLERELPVGGFKLDILGRDLSSGREVIIENQLEATDHGHLGQLLTYAAGLEAKIVIWMATEFKDEHRQALDWLNLQTGEDLSFFGIEIELLQVDDSLPAPHFKPVVKPNQWQKQTASTTKSEVSEKRIAYHEFFTDLLGKLKERSPGFTTSRSVGYDNWKTFSVGRTGFGVEATFMSEGRFAVDLYIDVGDRDRNKAAFDALKAEAAAIEAAVGEPLTWERLDHRRASRVAIYREGDVLSSPESRAILRDWAIDRLLRFKHAFEPRIRVVSLEPQTQRDVAS